MSGPTGYEVGGARPIEKPIVYTTEGISVSGLPTADNVFAQQRATFVPIGAVAEASPPYSQIVTDDQGNELILTAPSWGAPGTVIARPRNL